jgi:hypothetical protein
VHHLQKLGLVPTASGRGKKPRYSTEEVAIWAFCIELIQVGIAPTLIDRLVKKFWNGILYCFLEGSTWDEDCYFVFQPKMLSPDFPDNVDLSDTTSIRILRSSDFSEVTIDEMGGRVVAINVSLLDRHLQKTLGAPPGALGAKKDQ